VQFTPGQRRAVLTFRARELDIPTIAALCRRAGVDKGNMYRSLEGLPGMLSASSRARLAQVLLVDQEQLALLLGCDTIVVELGVWRELVGAGKGPRNPPPPSPIG
jgi:hypothetical protein